MKFSSAEVPSCEPDMTPMIDVTFQLIIFFMLTMNFSQDEQIELIRLPSSELAKPADAKAEIPLTIQISKHDLGKPELKEGKGRIVLFGGTWSDVPGVDGALLREKQLIESKGGTASRATVIIRADKEAHTGKVQELIKACQKRGFEKFVLRAKQELSGYSTMKFGKRDGLSHKLGFDMTPMIDVCFQLIIFFMLSMKIMSPEGDFNIKMPLGAVQGDPDPSQLPPIVIRLVVGNDGELDGVQVGTRPPQRINAGKYIGTFRAKYEGKEKAEERAQMAAHEAAEDDVFASVRTVVRSLVKKQGGPDSGPGSVDAANQEVEINADPQVKFRCVIKTINAVSGFREGTGSDSQVVKMIEKIRFSPPKKTAP